ncbi:hypothetical protein E1B28_010710 [Marasmius oreades]|uniref:Uncharacterized protein n=1 Tax=Marasmius oreades TaxID=181124 RepID=A0A9P7RY99_9AGAR|nr:uncharacterized protein E1B28_010710 [Marasmius oreades]KAG7091688.1 hypothetical protein E1B28_010710 [Marasmius oreades]
MGGDHKCPVCQATFTRPQHVARHMRSHTGDRPYKCQHCGDQFARSDLLSRHVNKCHAGEKATVGGAPPTGRRKGSSATRATTSKQACDQCVQSSLPCDGCNPCSKCVQRKCRCTYVKFHRQTAPIGPGHNPRSMASATTSTPSSLASAVGGGGGSIPNSILPNASVALYASSLHQHHAQHPGHTHPHHVAQQQQQLPPYGSLYGTDEFLLGPAPGCGIPNISGSTTGTTTSSSSSHELQPPSSNGTYAGSFTFPPVYAPQPPPGQGRQSHSDGESGLVGDYTTRYRELMRRGSVASSSYGGGGGDVDPTALMFPQFYGSGGGGGGGYYRSGSSSGGGAGGGGVVESESESESASASASGTSSATSSSVHLPNSGVGFPNGNQGYMLHSHQHQSSASPDHLHQTMPPPPSSSSSVSSGTQPSGPPAPSQTQTQTSGRLLSRPGTAHGVSSVFGLLSLDDPNVLAGLATDGQPFFHNAFGDSGGDGAGAGGGGGGGGGNDPNATPMPRFMNTSPHQGAGELPPSGEGGQQHGQRSGGKQVQHGFPQTPGVNREQETRELREFWKQYMRTPLSGGAAGVMGLPTPGGQGQGQQDVHMMSPGILGYRRGRVSSMPSAKTPTDEEMGGGGYLGTYAGQYRYSNSTSSQKQRHPQQQQQQQQQTVTGSGTDDLKSYEAAVMARKAPTNLNIAPKIRNRRFGDGIEAGKGAGFALTLPAGRGGTNGVGGATGGAGAGTGAGAAAAASAAASSTSGSTSPSKRRPTYKRLASQTLESGVSKRALLSWQGEDGDGDGDDEGDEGDEGGDGDDDSGFTSSGGVHLSPQMQSLGGRESSGSPVVRGGGVQGGSPMMHFGGVGGGSGGSSSLVSTDA